MHLHLFEEVRRVRLVRRPNRSMSGADQVPARDRRLTDGGLDRVGIRYQGLVIRDEGFSHSERHERRVFEELGRSAELADGRLHTVQQRIDAGGRVIGEQRLQPWSPTISPSAFSVSVRPSV